MSSEGLAKFGDAVRFGIDVGEHCIAKHGEFAQREIAIEEMAEFGCSMTTEETKPC